MLVRDLGLQPYEPVWRDMQAFTRDRDQQTPDELWCLQHEPVFTLGQAGKPEHILDPHHIPVIKSDRGGQVTYHGPGQLVIYLLVDLRRYGLGARAMVDLIETTLLGVLKDFGIQAGLREGAPGVYVNGCKIGALGLRVRRGCSFHGLSLNIDMDQTPFTWINPCGYEGLQSIQMRDLLPAAPASLFSDVQQALANALVQALVQLRA